MFCPNCHNNLSFKDGEYICTKCGLIHQVEDEQSKTSNSSMRFPKLGMMELALAGPLEAVTLAFDSVLIFVLFEFAVIKWLKFKDTYLNHYLSDIPEFFVSTLIIIVIAFFQLLLMKRILYQLKGKKLRIGNVFHWEGIKRGFIVITRLLLVNIVPCALIFMMGARIGENPYSYSLISLLFFILFTTFVTMILIILDFVLIEYEATVVISFLFTMDLLKAYKIKLILLSFFFMVVTSLFIYNLTNGMKTIFMSREEMKGIQSVATNLTVFFSNFLFFFYLGTYHQIKSNKHPQ